MAKLARLDFTEHVISPDDPDMKAEMLLLSASVRVPALEHDGVRVWDAEHGAGCTLSARSFVMDPQTIRKLIDKTDICKLQPLLETNHLTLKRALFLRRSRISLETF